MKIAGLAGERGRRELEARAAGAGIQLAWANSVAALSEHPDAIAYFDLSFEMNAVRIEQLRQLFPKPVVINSVIHTLKEIGQPFVRINAWPGFLERNICEIAFFENANGREDSKSRENGNEKRSEDANGLDNEDAKSHKDDEDAKSHKDDEDAKKHTDNEDTKSHQVDEDAKSHKVDEDAKSHKDDEDAKKHTDNEDTKSHQVDEDASRSEDEKKIAAVLKKLNWPYRVTPDIPGMISARIVAAIINEAYYTLQDEVSTKESIDTAMKLGTHYPHGPFEWVSLTGLQNIHDLLSAMEITDPCYKISDLLKQEVWKQAH